jgi:ABC-2 type transport system ATP-binding protein
LEVALAADKLGRRYRRQGPWAVRDLSFTVPAGSVTALVGPNGAGKSTLIRCWMGFERPDAGTALVGSIDPQRQRDRAIASIGYVAQSNALYRAWAIDDHFRWVAGYRSSFDRGYAIKRVERLGLDLSRKVSELSGGEKAQVALTIALSLRAPILLLDEPTASLDPLARREFLAILVEDVRESGATVILSSHVITDIEQACDSVIVLSHGWLLLHDTIEDARDQHIAMPLASLNMLAPIATFAGPKGEPLALVRAAAEPSQRATLEEIVLGYLATPTARSPIPDAR